MSDTDDAVFIRHYSDLDQDKGDYGDAYVWRRDRLPKVIATLPQRPDNLGKIIGDEIVAAGLAHKLFPDDPAVRGHLQSAARMAGVAAQLLMPDAPASVTLWLKERGLPPVEVPRTTPRGLRFDWKTAVDGFHAAFAAREEGALASLAALPVEALDDKEWGIEFHAFLPPEFRALQGLYLNAPWLGEALQTWMRATDPDTLPEWSIDQALNISVMGIELIMATTKDSTPAHFDKALTKALKLHKKYWATQDSISDLLALPPLAYACLKRDMGYQTTVRSDYLPMSVVEAGAPPVRPEA